MARPGGRVGAIPAKMVCHRGAGGGRDHLGYAALREQAAVNSSRSHAVLQRGSSWSVRSNLGRSRRKISLACCCDQRWKETRLIDKSARKRRKKRRSKR